MNKRSWVFLWCAAASLLAGCGVWQFGVGPEDAATTPPPDAAQGVVASCEATKYCWDFTKIEKKEDLKDWKLGSCWDVAGSAGAGSVQHALYLKDCKGEPPTNPPSDVEKYDALLPEINCSSQSPKLGKIKIRQSVNIPIGPNLAEIYQNETETPLQKIKVVTGDQEMKLSACPTNKKLQIQLHANVAMGSTLSLGLWRIQRIEIVP